MEIATQKTYTVDLTDASLGRSATRVASILRGKNTVAFAPNAIPNVIVRVRNVAGLKLPIRKRESTIYVRYSGYPGGKKEETMQRVIERKGVEEVFRRAVRGMLPANRLRDRMMKRLVFD